MKLEGAEFQIEIDGLKPKVTRHLTYSNGDSISFTVTMENASDYTLAELHQHSAKQVIEMLKDWLKPQQAHQ